MIRYLLHCFLLLYDFRTCPTLLFVSLAFGEVASLCLPRFERSQHLSFLLVLLGLLDRRVKNILDVLVFVVDVVVAGVGDGKGGYSSSLASVIGQLFPL